MPASSAAWMMRMLSSAPVGAPGLPVPSPKFMVPRVRGLMGVPDRPNTRSSLRLIRGLLHLVAVPWIVTRLHRFGRPLQNPALVLRFSSHGVTGAAGMTFYGAQTAAKSAYIEA